MVTTQAAQKAKERSAQKKSSNIRKKHIFLHTVVATATMAINMSSSLIKTPQHTSILSGIQWIQELLVWHDVQFHNMLGMSKHVFKKLLSELSKYGGLQPTRYVTATEQLGIFLCMARVGSSNRDMQERFQQSGDTISKAFHRVLGCIISSMFYNRYVKLPPNDQTPPEIRENPKLWPFFKLCLGALDGTHIDAFVPNEHAPAYRDRKGRLSTNVLAACTFDMCFSYLLVGWEGSAADGRIFADAHNSGLAIPPGKFYLGDAGFPLCNTLLVPYRGVRYHLKEWGCAPQKPKDFKELFNLCHSQACNVIERIFGVVKRHFQLINIAPEYDLAVQAKIILALCVLHNFIRIYDPDDLMDDNEIKTRDEGLGQPAPQQQPDEYGHNVSIEERDQATILQDGIAKVMWEQYKEILRERENKDI